jgi:hypothetical protein
MGRHALIALSFFSQKLDDFEIYSTAVGNNWIHQITGQSWEGKILMPSIKAQVSK